jgi:phosphatidylglycerophosphate synthase
MVKRAVVFSHGGAACDSAPRGADAPSPSMRERVLLGHPLIVRSIIAAARAGVREFLIVCDEGADRLSALLEGNRVLARQDCVWECRNAVDIKTAQENGADRVARGIPGTEETPGLRDDAFLLLSDTAVFKEDSLARLLDVELAGKSAFLLVNKNDQALSEYEGMWCLLVDVPVAEWDKMNSKIVSDAELCTRSEKASDELKEGNAVWTGFALCQGELFWELLNEFIKLSNSLCSRGEGAERGGNSLITVWVCTAVRFATAYCALQAHGIAPKDGSIKGFHTLLAPHTTGVMPFEQGYDVRSTALYKPARRMLLTSVRKPSDGFVARHFNRYVSLFLSRIFIALGASPNFISGANLLLALLAAVLLAWGEYAYTFIAALLFQLTSIIDGSDGEVAKLTWKMSPKGAWIDTLCDQLSYLMFFVALPLGLYNSPVQETYTFMIPALGRETFLILGGATLVAFVLMFLVMARYVRRVQGEGSMLQILKDIEESARKKGLNALLCRLVSKLAFIFRRDFFAFAAMVMLILNFAGALMWIVASACWLMVLYLVYYSEHRFRGAS